MVDSNVRDKIPHRPPFLWVDTVVTIENERILTEKYIAENLDIFSGHYPGYPILPGVIICEAAFQSGALLISHKHTNEIKASGLPVVTRIEQAKFKREVHPGDTMQIEVSLSERVGPAWFLRGKIRVKNRVVATVKFTCIMK